MKIILKPRRLNEFYGLGTKIKVSQQILEGDMSSKIPKKIEFITNIAIIVVAVLFGYSLLSKILSPIQQTKEIAKGSNINLTDIQWQPNQKILLLVLQVDCKYCTQSMPFYKTLVKTASEKGIRVIALLPNSLEESNQYLNEHGVEIQEVRQNSLSSVNVQGTPTLILLNDKGVVLNLWVGKLPSAKEEEVTTQL